MDLADAERRLAAGDAAGALRLTTPLVESGVVDARLLSVHAGSLLRAGNPRAAADVLTRATLAPDADAALLSALAVCQWAAGDGTSAEHSARRALDASPGQYILRLMYAESIERHDRDEAVAQYFNAIRTAQAQGRWLSDATTPPALRLRVKHAMDVVDEGRADFLDRVLSPHVERHGLAAMERVVEGVRVYLGFAAAPADDPRRPKFLHLPSLPRDAFFDRSMFAWYEALEDRAAAIAGEMREVLRSRDGMRAFLDLAPGGDEDAYLGGDAGRSWDGFFFYRHGERFGDSHARCPVTSAALDAVPLTRVLDHAPEVLFSVLAPSTHIKPHYGVTNTRVVTHLALQIPEGDCQLVVNGESRGWVEGRCMTFDDTCLHEAWNRTDRVRVVMLMDTWNPYLRAEECEALRDIVEQVGAFNRRSGIA